MNLKTQHCMPPTRKGLLRTRLHKIPVMQVEEAIKKYDLACCGEERDPLLRPDDCVLSVRHQIISHLMK